MAGRSRNNNVVQDLIAALQGFAQNNNQGNQDPAGSAISRVIEQFRHYAPPKFNGRDGALALEKWFEELERIFEHIECNDAHRVSCAVFQLVEEAGQWWKSHRNGLTEVERQGLTWARFKEMAMDKYMPRAYRNQKKREFLEFKQGSLSVTEYELRYIQLARFATRLVAIEVDKTDFFLNGLRPEIRAILAMQENENYGLAVRRAHAVEAALEMEKVPKENGNFQGKRKWEHGEKSTQNEKERIENKQEAAPQHTYPQCPTCHKHHQGECIYRYRLCYNCRQSGHNALNCPNKGSKEPEKRENARLYNMVQQEDKEKS